MPATKTKKTTLRTILGRIKDRCDLIIAKGAGPNPKEQRYWRDKLATEMQDWRFEITKTELQLIQGVYDNRVVGTFDLDQPVKMGKTVRLKDDVGDSVTFQFINLTNLTK